MEKRAAMIRDLSAGIGCNAYDLANQPELSGSLTVLTQITAYGVLRFSSCKVCSI